MSDSLYSGYGWSPSITSWPPDKDVSTKRRRRTFPRVRMVGSFRGSFRDLGEQALGLLLQLENVSADLREAAELRRLVEVAREAHFVADLGFSLDDPGVWRVGEDFAADER